MSWKKNSIEIYFLIVLYNSVSTSCTYRMLLFRLVTGQLRDTFLNKSKKIYIIYFARFRERFISRLDDKNLFIGVSRRIFFKKVAILAVLM